MHIWRDRLSRWFEPLARRCPLSPNAVTLLALVLNVIAAALFYQRQFLIAIVFLFIGGWADAFDGIVARVQGKTSIYGDFLDHFADRVSDILLVTGWLLGNNVREEITLAVIIVVLLNGYIGTQIEASWHERNYDSVGRGEFLLALFVYPLVSYILIEGGWERVGFAGVVVAEWMSLLLLAFAIFGIVQRFGLAGRLRQRE